MASVVVHSGPGQPAVLPELAKQPASGTPSVCKLVPKHGQFGGWLYSGVSVNSVLICVRIRPYHTFIGLSGPKYSYLRMDIITFIL